MSKAFQKAKEKYDAVINDAGRGDWYCRTNRFGTTRHPSNGDCHAIGHIEHKPTHTITNGTRRGSTGSISDKIQRWGAR